jgi:hypothetical protein
MVFGMEDLVASAFIGLIQKKGNAKQKITLYQLAQYKKNILKELNEKQKTAVIPISRDYTAQFLYRFDDFFFYEENEEAGDSICLKKEKKLKDLQNRFLVYIPNEVRGYFENERNLKPILEDC